MFMPGSPYEASGHSRPLFPGVGFPNLRPYSGLPGAFWGYSVSFPVALASLTVAPAQAGAQKTFVKTTILLFFPAQLWVPAFAGTTRKRLLLTLNRSHESFGTSRESRAAA